MPCFVPYNTGRTADTMNHTFGRVTYDFEARTHIMGILNVTPDSFSDGGSHPGVEEAVGHALRMVEEGADFIDVGGESTRPGAEPVTEAEEMRRVLPVIESLARRTDTPISVDTRKAAVAEAALGSGATIVNDVSGLFGDDRMAGTVGRSGGSVVLMHMKGTPATMQLDPRYTDLIGEISGFLRAGIAAAREAGIRQVIVDPGLGFGKTVSDNLEILDRLGELRDLDCPIMVGPSRKSFIGALLGLPVDQRLEGTAGAVAVAVMNGARLVRVHDVAPAKRLLTVVDAVLKSGRPVPA